MQTRKRSLEDVSSRDADVPLPLTLVEPSMLHISTPERCTSSAASTPARTRHTDDAEDPPVKKPRKRSKAKTPDEIKACEDERAARNRRAAQESRERKRQLFESLESENEQLRQENRALKEQLATLEAWMEKFESQEAVVEEVKDENPAKTHCPAVVMSRDQQCQARSLRTFPPTPFLPIPSIFFHSSLNPESSISQLHQVKTTSNFSSIRSQISIIQSNSMTTSTFLRRPHSQPCPLAYLSRPCATLDSLNSSSLDSGVKFWTSSKAMRACDLGHFGSWYVAVGLVIVAVFTKLNLYNPLFLIFHLPSTVAIWFTIYNPQTFISHSDNLIHPLLLPRPPTNDGI